MWIPVPIFSLILALLFIPAVFIFTAFLLKSTSSRAMAIFSTCICILLIVFTIKEYHDTKTQVIQDDWVVYVDTVQKVGRGSTKTGKPVYYMILNEYGRVSLSRAGQYEEGEKCYIILIKDGNAYKRIESVYSVEYYNYVGEHYQIK